MVAVVGGVSEVSQVQQLVCYWSLTAGMFACAAQKHLFRALCLAYAGTYLSMFAQHVCLIIMLLASHA